MAEADRLFSELQVQLPWEQPTLRLFGREHRTPRLSAWVGDAAAIYTYSGRRFLPQPWLPILLSLRDRLASTCGRPFNSVLANLYRDGRDRMGWHADDEPELGAEPCIASLSLGAQRRFLLRPRGGGRSLGLELPHGSLLLMAGATQRNYLHALPATARPCCARINLTFRWVQPTAQRASPD